MVDNRAIIAILIVLIIALAAAIILLSSPHIQPTVENVSSNSSPTPAQITPLPPPKQVNTTAPSPPTLPPPQIINETIGGLLYDGFARADSSYYSMAQNGVLTTDTFTWAPTPLNQTPQSMPLKANDLRVSVIRFNGRYIDSLRGFGLKTYTIENASSAPKLLGTMVFISNNTTLDSLQNFDTDVDVYPGGAKVIEGCNINSSMDFVSSDGTDIKVYDFSCKIMYGAYP